MAGPHPDAFPLTRHSVVGALGATDVVARAAAFDVLARSYWRPVYAYIRLRWRREPEDARDLTQEFFTRALEKGYFDRYDASRARFRTFLRTCLDAFVANAAQHAGRLKRGGGLLERVDFGDVEAALPAALRSEQPDPEECFRREWIRGLLTEAIATLRDRCEAHDRALAFALFSRYDIEGPDAAARQTYTSLATELGTTAIDVTNQLAWARREFRAVVLEQLRALSGSDEEFQAEARALLGISPP